LSWDSSFQERLISDTTKDISVVAAISDIEDGDITHDGHENTNSR